MSSSNLATFRSWHEAEPIHCDFLLSTHWVLLYYLWLGEPFSASQAMKVEALAWWRRSVPTNFRTAPCRCFSFRREVRRMRVTDLDSLPCTFFKHMIDYSLARYLIARREVWTQCLGCSSDFSLPILHWVTCLEEKSFFEQFVTKTCNMFGQCHWPKFLGFPQLGQIDANLSLGHAVDLRTFESSKDKSQRTAMNQSNVCSTTMGHG